MLPIARATTSSLMFDIPPGITVMKEGDGRGATANENDASCPPFLVKNTYPTRRPAGSLTGRMIQYRTRGTGGHGATRGDSVVRGRDAGRWVAAA
jgi:hypothetical protein